MSETAATDKLLESLIILNRDGVIKWASPYIHLLLGYRAEELQGREIFDLLTVSPSRKRIRQLFHRLQETCTEVNEGLSQFTKKDGETIALYLTLGKLTLESGETAVLVHLSFFENRENDLNCNHTDLEIEVRKKVAEQFAAELHDNINPSLVGAKLLVEDSIQNSLQGLKQLEDVATVLKEVIEHIRDLSNAIVQDTHNNFNLRSSLTSLVDHYKTSQLRIVLRYDGRLEDGLKIVQKVHVIRIIKEQLLNIVKHSAANKVLISLQSSNGRASIVTKDNGKGFDTKRKEKGIGISNIAQRVNALKGNMHINTNEGEGTAIRIIFPRDS